MLQHPTATPLPPGAASSHALLLWRDGLGSPVPRSLLVPAEPTAAELGSGRAAVGDAALLSAQPKQGVPIRYPVCPLPSALLSPAPRLCSHRWAGGM